MQAQSSAPKSGVSNRFVYGCLMLFALPFVIFGLLALVQGIRQYPTKPNAIVAIIVGAPAIRTSQGTAPPEPDTAVLLTAAATVGDAAISTGAPAP